MLATQSGNNKIRVKSTHEDREYKTYIKRFYYCNLSKESGKYDVSFPGLPFVAMSTDLKFKDDKQD